MRSTKDMGSRHLYLSGSMEACFTVAANVYGFYIKQPFIFAITLPTNKKETRNAKDLGNLTAPIPLQIRSNSVLSLS